MADIGFIGLGNMGLPMAKALIEAGHALMAFDLDQQAMKAAQDAGATPASSAAAAAGFGEIVITMLPEGRHVRAVYSGKEGVIAHAKADALLIDCSTIDVETARQINAEAREERGLELLDAPVSGGTSGAENATLTFMVGGSAHGIDRATPILAKMGKSIVRTGASGTGQAAKICNNLILGISMIGVCEAFALAEKLGLDAAKLFEVSSTSSGQCWSLTSYCPVPGPVPGSPANRDYSPGFAASMMAKDLRLAQGAARDVNMASPLGAQAQNLYALFEGLGHGELDFSGIFKLITAKI